MPIAELQDVVLFRQILAFTHRRQLQRRRLRALIDELGQALDERSLALSRAKLQMGRSTRHVGQEAVQLHGGIGVTDEYIVSQCFKRFDHVWCNRPDGQCEHAGGRCIDRDSPPGTKLGERTFNGGLAGCGE
jgi:alkylation response protein AidB-like acyl-CoA dehydrogenase